LLSMNNLASLYQNQGQYHQAETLFKKMLALSKQALGEQHLFTLVSMNNLALFYQNQEQYGLAEPLYKQLLTLSKQHQSTLTVMGNLASLYRDQGQYGLAEPLYKQRLLLSKQQLGKQHPQTITAMSNLALFYQNQEQYALAEPLYKQVLALRKQVLGKLHPNTLFTMYNLAGIYQASENWVEAEKLIKKVLPLSNTVIDKLLWESGKKTRQAYLHLQQLEFWRNHSLSFYAVRSIPEEAFYFSLSRKGVLLRISSEISSLAKKSDDPALKKLINEINALKTQLSSLPFSGKEDKKQVEALELKINDAEMSLGQKVSGFNRSKTEVTPEQIQKKLKLDQALLDFQVYKEVDLKTNKYKSEQVIALIADQQKIKLIHLGEVAPIATAIKTFRLAIGPTYKNTSNQTFSNTRQQTLTQAAQILYQKLWQPLESHLQDKKTLYVIPDGMLHLLPFKALQNNEGKYLAEQYQLVQLASARDIVIPQLQGTTTQATIFAAPDYGDDSSIFRSGNTSGTGELKNIHFKPLANALQEGQQIDKLFRKKQPNSPAKLYLRKQATEQAIFKITNPKILHLATHGFFLEDQKTNEKNLKQEFDLMQSINQPTPPIKINNPLIRSGLAFANANLGVKGIKQADDTDGILTALEVLSLDLIGTELVTLSACDTGIGDIKNGEGVYSLNRAFQEAGAKAVLSTLWKVDDEATSEFMQNFYNRFLEGIPAQQAIQATQATQLEFMQNEKYYDPFYWAGFVMTGKE